MKKLFILLLSFVSLAARSQTVDEIIQQYTKNMGGLDAFNKIATAKLTGTYSTQGNDFPMTIQVINGKAMRTDIDVSGTSVVNVYFNGKGWKINPFAGAPDATDVTGSELNEFRTQAYIANSLMDYKARGHQVELQGEETVEGIRAYKIRLTSKEDGKVTTFFINKADYAMISSVTNREIQGQEIEVESIYSDRKEFAGVKFFMTRESKIEGQVIQSVKFENIELNIAIDEKIFQKN